MSFYGMVGYNSNGTYRTGPAASPVRDVFGRTAEDRAREEQELRAMISTQKGEEPDCTHQHPHVQKLGSVICGRCRLVLYHGQLR